MNFVKRLASNCRFSHMRNFLPRLFIAGAVLAGIGCAQIKTPVAQMKAAPAGSRFDQIGRVSLYAGEPCTTQIMFDFQSAGSTIRLGAPMRETKILTDAAKRNRRVHVSGKWRRGGQSNCSYVEVTTVEITK